MKTKDFPNKLWSSLLVVLPMMLCVFLTTACDPSIVNAQHRLEGLLNSEDGQQMTADELANMSRSSGDKVKGAGVEIHLPITNVDTRPKEGVTYKCEDDSTTLVFSLKDAPDTLRTIGTVDIEWHQNIWGESYGDGRKPDYCQYYVQSRGKGIYTLWNYQAQYKNGNVIFTEEGDTLKAPFFEGMLIFVYPEAGKILITRGHPDTEHTYYVKSEN